MSKLNFSQRMGIAPIKSIQISSMDEDLRNSLWNAFYQIYELVLLEKGRGRLDISCDQFFKKIWIKFLKPPVDTILYTPEQNINLIRNFFYDSDWTYPYRLIEFIVNNFDDGSLQSFFNKILGEDCSGYRFIDGILSPIIEEQDVQEIEAVISDDNYVGVSTHIKTALRMLSDRENPDYRNSIKESISAVEAIAKIITGKPKATLGDALKVIDDVICIHSSLKLGFDKIYGYTCNEGGLRHSFIDENTKDFTQADARYFLVSCSAFVNYLKELSIKK